jgi:cobalt-zinc-cadmium efflux system protein
MHAHDHETDHSHGHGHAHVEANTDRRRILWAMLLTGGFMGAEVVGGLLSGSLALLADAAHMLTDAASLGLAWVAFQLTDRPADSRRTFGFHRFPVLAAFVNGLALFVIVAWIAFEAVQRLLDPAPVMGGMMAVIAFIGLLVNAAAFWILHGGSRENLNMRGAALHVLGDLLGSVGALVGAGVILLTGWTPIDPILSLLVAAIVLRSAWFLVRQSAHVLLEGAPEAIDPATVTADIEREVKGVHGVHHVHVWSLSPQRPMLSLHLQASGEVEHDRLVASVKRFVADRFGVEHTTLQVEYDDACIDHTVAPRGQH